MKKILIVLLIALFIPFFSKASEIETRKPAAYFYASWCLHCQKVDKYFNEKGFYEKYDIVKFNFDVPENKILLGKIFQAKNDEDARIPAVIIDDDILFGDVEIINGFEKKIEESTGSVNEFLGIFGTGKADERKIVKSQKENEKESAKEGKNSKLAFPLIFSAALSDAINPCAFAVLILLIATVVKAKSKRRALWSGIMFSIAVFISYFLMGLGLYKVITIFNIPKYFSFAIGILAILIGLANLKDAFWYGKFFLVEVPLSWRPQMQKIIRHVTSPFGAFLAGILVSLFLLPCSSGPYVVIVGLLAEKVNMAVTVMQLLLYNFIFILPMIAITLGMYFFNLKMGDLENMRKENLKRLHAVVGTLMLLMGIYLISGWLV